MEMFNSRELTRFPIQELSIGFSPKCLLVHKNAQVYLVLKMPLVKIEMKQTNAAQDGDGTQVYYIYNIYNKDINASSPKAEKKNNVQNYNFY